MNKCLILLTNVSPDTIGESFVSNELEFHSRSFRKVIVVPIQSSSEGFKGNSYPENVDVIDAPAFSGKKAKLLDLLSGFFYIFKRNEALKSEKTVIGKSLKRLLFANYFEARNSRCFKQCVKALENYDLSQFDEVVVYSFWFFLPCRIGVDLTNKLRADNIKVSFVTRAHGYDIYQYVNKLNYLPMRSFLAKNVEKIFPCSRNGAEYLKTQLPEYNEKIHHSYLGSFDFGLGNYDSTFNILTCSHTVEVKRLDRLIEALSKLNGSGLNIKWTHIGDGELQEKIKSLAAQKLGFMNVEFMGKLDNSEVMNYYKNNPVSLFINVSESEGLPVSLMEATSFGTPVMATDVGGTSEIITDGNNGKLIPKEYTDKEFADSLLYFYNMKQDEYQQFRDNARTYWENNFNAEKNYSEFSAMLANLK